MRETTRGMCQGAKTTEGDERLSKSSKQTRDEDEDDGGINLESGYGT